MLVDGADEAKLNEQLQLELAAMKKRHEANQAVIGSWIDIGPAMGMIGTLVGLVAMLGNMADPKSYWTCYGSCSFNYLIWCYVSKCNFFTDEINFRTKYTKRNSI